MKEDVSSFTSPLVGGKVFAGGNSLLTSSLVGEVVPKGRVRGILGELRC
jgi:hypothetical protein